MDGVLRCTRHQRTATVVGEGVVLAVGERGQSRARKVDLYISILLLGGIVVALGLLANTGRGVVGELSSIFLALLATVATFPLIAYIERVAPAAPHKSLSGWILNLRISIFHFFGVALTAVISASVVNALSRHYQLGWFDLKFAQHGGGMAVAFALLLSLFIGDFFFYWTHVLAHKNRVLWQQHKVHHMDEQMNVTTLGRVDWLEYMPRILTISIPMSFLFKLDPAPEGAMGFVVDVLIAAWPAFYHSNVKVGFGWASMLIVGPQFHRIHHSRLPEHLDKNFAGWFPIWDLIFGTYYHPHHDEFPATGVAGEIEVTSFVDAVLIPFRGWMKMLRESCRRSKLCA